MIVVAAPAVIVAAIFALLFMLAWAQYGGAISNTLNVNVPVIGNVIGRLITEGLEATYALVVMWFDAAVPPVAQLILSPIATVENIAGGLLLSTEQAYNAIYSIVATRIPAALSQAVTWANQVGAAATATATSYFDQAVGYANQVGASAVATATSYFDQAIGYANQIGGQAAALAQNYFDQAVGYANQVGASAVATATALYDQGVQFTRDAYTASTTYTETLALAGQNDLAQAITNLEGYADATATAAVGVLSTDIDGAITSALSGIYVDIDGAITDVVGVIGTGDADVLAGIRAIPTSVPIDLAGVATLAGATTLTLTRYLRDCGIPNCQNLSGLGNDLQALLGLVGDASFLAFLVELIDHPTAAEQTVTGVFGSQVSAATSAARSLLSV